MATRIALVTGGSRGLEKRWHSHHQGVAVVIRLTNAFAVSSGLSIMIQFI